MLFLCFVCINIERVDQVIAAVTSVHASLWLRLKVIRIVGVLVWTGQWKSTVTQGTSKSSPNDSYTLVISFALEFVSINWTPLSWHRKKAMQIIFVLANTPCVQQSSVNMSSTMVTSQRWAILHICTHTKT